MSDVKVSYFDITGSAEPIRLLLTYAGNPFEDDRVEMENWPRLKPYTPFGKLPVYEEDDKVATQSKAIARYLGKKCNLVGETDWENLELDAIVDTLYDFNLKIAEYFYEQDATVKEAKRATLGNETLPFYLSKLDAIAKENGGHLAIKKLNWADFFFSGGHGYFSAMWGSDLTENYPNLAAVKDNVFAIPSVKAWIDTHPQGKLIVDAA